MSRRRERSPTGSRWAAGAAALASAMLVLAAISGSVWAAFTSKASSIGNELRTAPDYVAPTAASSVVQKTQGGTAGYIHQGGTYRVYGSVTDTGNPASGIGSVTGNLSTVTTGQSSSAFSSGSFSVAGTTYNYATGTLTANATLAAATYGYTLSSTDLAANSRSQSDYSVIVDNTAPTSSAIATANGGSITGRPEQNDTVTFTFTEPIEPGTILSGWTGAATNTVVRINDGGISNDTLLVYNAANTTQLPFTSVNLGRTDYVTTSRTFGATGTASAMTMSGNSVSVVLGTASGAGTTALSTGSMTWTRSTTPTDRAGNAVTSGTFTETGTADKEF